MSETLKMLEMLKQLELDSTTWGCTTGKVNRASFDVH